MIYEIGRDESSEWLNKQSLLKVSDIKFFSKKSLDKESGFFLWEKFEIIKCLLLSYKYCFKIFFLDIRKHIIYIVTMMLNIQ